MGIIKAAVGAVGGTLADSWLESYRAADMGENTVMTVGQAARNDKRSSNTKGSEGMISNGSMLQVEQNQFMLLTDGGKIVDYTAEPGYYKVDNSSAPSLFNGKFSESLKETFNRFKFGGTPSTRQRAYFINTQEIKNIAFGTSSPVNYFDSFYNAELYLRAHGYFSIRIVDPLKFYAEAVPRDADRVNIGDISKLYLAEFLTALQTSINKMSADGIRISFVTSKAQELADYMSTVLDKSWNDRRGMIIESVGLESISYDDSSKKLIDMRNQGAMLGDPTIREGYVQGSVARGMEAAGSNAAGSMAGFMGMGIGMQAGGGFVGAASNANMQQAQMQQQTAQGAQTAGWACSCGQAGNKGNFCANCGKPQPGQEWVCSCGQAGNKGNFCANCGKPRA